MQRNTIAVIAAVVVAAGGASALAAVSADSGTIHACKHVKRGIVRIPRPNAVCQRNERAVSWAVRGPQGPAGPQGPRGDQGPQGPPGTGGAGLANLGSLAGLACTTYDGGAGTVDLDVSPENLVLISCDPPGGTPDYPPDEPSDGGGAAELVINEVDYDQVGADAGGFVEIANTGDAEATLTGVTLVLVNGGDGIEYDHVALTGTLAAGGYLEVEIDPQNGAPDGLALVSGTALLDALSYEGEIHSATIGSSTYDLVEGTPLAATVADSNTVDGTLARIPDGTDTDNAAADWRFTATPTPGVANVLSP